MAEVTITIGGREFEVACQNGEEHFLQSASMMLDREASVLVNQIGRMPEGRMLLMAGLMLADKTAAVEDQARELTARIQTLEKELADARANPTKVEVPVLPEGLTDTLAELSARAESLADKVEETL
ncbi:cell division protein ZapA [Thioclava sp. SK-1]|uniref:cell division protein ZapA n=1 Tax=Thioclava sp. SK-1 TaxID=1889770 RepID=UPI0008261F15|nr:cell division protein ZapA [Thioclava sp. SK-1]OCX67149.1 cell division protein ZapA [Thioclava sp. SK-1]